MGNSHDQAVEEVMDTFGMTREEAEEVVELEEVGFVMNEDGVILPDVDPDAPIDMERFTDQEDTVKWN